MSVELGHFALILAALVALCQGVLPLTGTLLTQVQQCHSLMMLARPTAFLQFALIALAFARLAVAFLSNDFSVAYVAQHSNSLLPKPYQFAAVWGGHEGSLLLWIVMLSGWGGAVALFSRNLPLPMVAREMVKEWTCWRSRRRSIWCSRVSRRPLTTPARSRATRTDPRRRRRRRDRRGAPRRAGW